MKNLEKILQFIDLKGITKSAFEKKSGLSNSYLANIGKTNSEISDKMWDKMFKAYPELENYIENPLENKPSKKTADEIRNQKAIGSDDDEGLIYVPRAVQAGYALRNEDPIFIRQLKRWKIPDFPYKGDRFRIFQIEGDSMCHTDDNGNVVGLLDGMEVVAERVDPEDWIYSTQWYIHVIVFEDYLAIKRLYREEGNKTFVLTSDNPNYAQRRVKIEDIKELWIMKRYLGWNAPPPKQYTITI